MASNEFNIYPNPTDDKINVVLNYKNGNNRIQLRDLSGKLIMEKEINNQDQIDLRDLNQGLYLLTILSNNEIIGFERIVRK